MDVLRVIIGSGAWAVGRLKNPEKSRVKIFDAQFRAYREKETPSGIVTKFCAWIDIRDIITYATFGDDRLRGLGVAGVEFPISPLTCVIALTTLALLRVCYNVMYYV